MPERPLVGQRRTAKTRVLLGSADRKRSSPRARGVRLLGLVHLVGQRVSASYPSWKPTVLHQPIHLINRPHQPIHLINRMGTSHGKDSYSYHTTKPSPS